MNYKLYELVHIWGVVIFFLLLVITIILFFKWNIIKIVKDLLGITAKNTIKNITWTQESVTWETKEITGMKGIEKIDSKSFFIEKEIIYVHCSSNNNIVNNHCE